MERDIILVLDLFEDDGNLYSNEDFLKVKTFPVKYRVCLQVSPTGMIK